MNTSLVLSHKSEKNVSDFEKKSFMTVKQVAEVLGVSERTIRETAKSKGVEGTFHTLKTNGGKQSVKVFTEEQATIIKQEIQKHHNLTTRQIDTVSTEFEENQTIANAMAILQRRSIELQQQLENKNKRIEELTPDAESWRAFAESDGTFSATNVAKLLKIKRDDILQFLEIKKYIMRERHDNPDKKGKYQATALGIDLGYVKNYLYTKDNFSCVQFHITPKGMQKIEKAFCNNGFTPEQQKRINALCIEAEKNMKPSVLGKAE